ncbi:hypothetical protein AB0I91_32375 [Actinosynnema sp. NPDC049800]|jgi:hypothetical protein
MTTPEPSGPLWAEVKARYDPWPPDDEVVAQQLGAAWRGAAGAVTDAGAEVTTSGRAAHASWQDTGGETVEGQAAAVGSTFEQLGQRQLQQAVLAEDYATSLIRTKQGIHDVVAAYSPLYEAALISPHDPGDMMVVDYVNRIVDAAGEAILRLLTIESHGPGIDPEGRLPTPESLATGGPIIGGDLNFYFDHGTWKAFDGTVEGEYSAGLHLTGAINQPRSEDPLIDLEAQFGVQVSGPELEHSLGPLTVSAQPEVYVGPGAKFALDVINENGKVGLGFKVGASAIAGGALNGELALDFGEIGRSLFPF